MERRTLCQALSLAGLGGWSAARATALADPAVWAPLGGAVDHSDVVVTVPSMDVGPSNQTVVAYLAESLRDDGRVVTHLFVKRWTGQRWEPLGDALNASLDCAAHSPSLKVNLQDQAVVAWCEADDAAASSLSVRVKRWNGSSWDLLGDTLNSVVGEAAVQPSLALLPGGFPVVALVEFGPLGSVVRVKQWLNLALWFTRPEPFGLGDESQPVIATDGQLRYAVAAVRGRQKILVSRWHGRYWYSLPSPLGSMTGARVSRPSMLLGPIGKLVLAWQAQTAAGSWVAPVTTWNAFVGGWQPMGAPLDHHGAAGGAMRPRLALSISGRWGVAYRSASANDVWVLTWQDGAWIAAGDGAVAPLAQADHDFRFDAKSRPLVVAVESPPGQVASLRLRRLG